MVCAYKTHTNLKDMGVLSRQTSVLSAAAHDLDSTGFVSPFNLQAIENSLVAMAESVQDSAAEYDSTLGPFIIQIRNLITQMQKTLVIRHDDDQDELDTRWNDFLFCTENASADAFRDFNDLNQTYQTCRVRESANWTKWDRCSLALETAIKDLSIWKDLFRSSDNLNTANYTYSCMYPGAETLPYGTSAMPYMWQLRDQFRGAWLTWYYYKHQMIEAQSRVDNLTVECASNLMSYVRTNKQCDKYQMFLESAACPGGGGSDPCQAYMKCYKDRKEDWLRYNATLTDEEAGMKAEWRGILRINCLLDAFDAQINQGADLNTGINKCQDQPYLTKYYENLSIMEIDWHPIKRLNESIPPLVYCNETVNLSFIPGSLEWALTFEYKLPEQTTFQACHASCCNSTGAWVQDQIATEWCGVTQNSQDGNRTRQHLQTVGLNRVQWNPAIPNPDWDLPFGFVFSPDYGYRMCVSKNLPFANLTDTCQQACSVGSWCAMIFVDDPAAVDVPCCYPSQRLWQCPAVTKGIPIKPGKYYLNVYGQLLRNTTPIYAGRSAGR